MAPFEFVINRCEKYAKAFFQERRTGQAIATILIIHSGEYLCQSYFTKLANPVK